MIVVIIILSIALVGFIAATIVFSKKNKKTQRDYTYLENQNIHLIDENKLLRKTYNDLSSEKEKSSENRIVDLNQRIEEKEEEFKEALKKYYKLKDDLYRLTIATNSLSINFENTSTEYQNLIEKNKEALAERESVTKAIEEMKPQLDKLMGEIKELSERKRLAILNQEQYEEGVYEFSITAKEKELISILERVKSDYPDLKTDFATIEWKKIWLPKVQDLGNRIGLGKKGIYRLILKENTNVCYVGQAVNIQDRWYQHIKKMIGSETKGNEKLYNYRPEDFYWCVLEVDPKNINEAEHYWIEYFSCKEVGLNKKA